MDLLFKEYASPFLLLDEIIQSGRLCDFLTTFADKYKERQRWDYYVHKLPPWDDTTWEEFNRILDMQDEPQVTKEEQLETTINNSFGILEDFDPDF